MRKKSHISLARYIVNSLDDKELKKHRFSFYIGSVLPDIKPSFIYKRHEINGTFPYVKKHIARLSEGQKVMNKKNRKYYRDLGQVSHYLADYFTFPHNKNFTGNLYEHNKYEKHLKNHLKRYIESGAADRMVILPVNFGSFRELVEYIGNAHERYLLKERNIAEDVQYILRICSQVIHGILQLAAKQFGREDILIPAAC